MTIATVPSRVAHRAGCWLGDVLDACARLRIEDAVTMQRVAALVLGPPRVVNAVSPPDEQPREPIPSSQKTDGDRDPPADTAPGAGAGADAGAPEAAEVQAHLVDVTPPSPRALEPAPTAIVLTDVGDDWQLGLEPLFLPATARAIARELVSLRAPSTRLDVDALVSRSAEARPLGQPPFIETLTTRFGVDVLVDIGRSMVPFRADAGAFPDLLARLLGRHAVRTLSFDTVPSRAGNGLRKRWSAYTPAGPRRVILVTRLDHFDGDGATAEAWEEAVRGIERGGATAVAVVPHDPKLAPPRVCARMEVVEWDRSTTVSTVHRVIWGAR